jgi:phosphoglycerate dehydrogenase-like enzyme
VTNRPPLAFAMYGRWDPVPLTDAQRNRLEELCEVLDWRPLGRFDDDRARTVLARAEVLFAHWGCPLLDADALALAPGLRLLAYAGGTVKQVVTPAVFEQHVLVTTAANANAKPVAEYTLAVILLANKNTFVAHELSRPGTEPGSLSLPTPGNYAKTIGIVGASNVGRRVIELLRPYDLGVIVADPYLSAADAQSLLVEKVELDDLLARADVVSLHAPALPSTEGMIGARELARMKDGATLVNTARGSLVDARALERELGSGRISAVLDVTDPDEPLPPDSPLHALPNAFVTPHIAGSNGTEVERLADFALEEIRLYVAGEPPRHPVGADDLERIA